jgi:subtilisin family serine protease
VQSKTLISANVSHNFGMTGSGAVVAILDTGIEGTHAAFGNRLVEEACFSTNYSTYNSTNLCPSSNSWPNRQIVKTGTGAASLEKCTDVDCSHGTHVAGIVAGNDASITGIAPDANLIAIQVFSRFGSESECGVGKAPCILAFDSDVQSALEYVADLSDGTINNYNLAAVNMSLSGNTYSTSCDASVPYSATINALSNFGIAVVVASGNNSITNKIGAPACVTNAFSVGSVIDTSDVVSSWSNAHPALLDILAPGQGVRSALPNGTYGTKSGTSMAAPHVAGSFALLKAYNGTLTLNEMKSLLITHSKTVIDTRPEPDQSYPRLDLGKVTQYLAGTAHVPVVTITQPTNNAIINPQQLPVVLQASASDPQQGDLSAQIIWTSDIDGIITSPASLSLGIHQLQATVTDNIGFSSSDTVTVSVLNRPSVSINSPLDGQQFLQSLNVSLTASASDIEDGDLSSLVQWYSDRDGNLGTGATVNVSLSAGIHSISATVSDSDGATPTAVPSITITVIPDADADGIDDDWEAFYGVTDPAADNDGDSLTNMEEYLASSNPVDAAPIVSILSPSNNASFDTLSTIVLTASAIDNEDGDISSNISWHSSIDGALGSGAVISSHLSEGSHTITAAVLDSLGATPVVIPTINVTISLGAAGDISGDGIVNLTDLLLLQRYLTNNINLDTNAISRGDLYPQPSDGVLTISDALQLQKMLMQ